MVEKKDYPDADRLILLAKCAPESLNGIRIKLISCAYEISVIRDRYWDNKCGCIDIWVRRRVFRFPDGTKIKGGESKSITLFSCGKPYHAATRPITVLDWNDK